MDITAIIGKIDETSRKNIVKFVSDNGRHTCRECSENDGRIFDIDDPQIPQLPIHPHCRCKYVTLDRTGRDVSQQVEKHRIINNLIGTHGIPEDQAEALAKQIIDARMREEKLREQNLFLLFDGSRLLSSNGKLLLNAVSGKPIDEDKKYQKLYDHYEKTSYRTFDYSYDRQGIIGKGGIPQGLYYIVVSEERSAYSSPISHLCGYPGWGKYAWSLHPDDNTNMRGRSGFFIHGGVESGSAGCIDLCRQDCAFRDYLLSSGLKSLYVYVYYSQEIVNTVEKRSMDYPPSPHHILTDTDTLFRK